MATPCEQAGFHVGDYVRLVEDIEFLFEGAILEMVKDDEDKIPYFRLIDGVWTEEAKNFGTQKLETFCVHIKRVKKLGEF